MPDDEAVMDMIKAEQNYHRKIGKAPPGKKEGRGNLATLRAENARLKKLVREIAEWFNHMRPELDKEDGFTIYVDDFFNHPLVQEIMKEDVEVETKP